MRLSPTWGLQLRATVAAISTAWVVYATGWGSLLVIAYTIAIADAIRVHGCARVAARTRVEHRRRLRR